MQTLHNLNLKVNTSWLDILSALEFKNIVAIVFFNSLIPPHVPAQVYKATPPYNLQYTAQEVRVTKDHHGIPFKRGGKVCLLYYINQYLYIPLRHQQQRA